MVFSAIPQVVTEDRASGAQFIDGSLKFDGSKVQHLTRTPTTAGNRKKWTWSGWCKHGGYISASNGTALFAAYTSNADRDVIRYGGTSTDSLDAQLRDGTNRGIYTTSKFRDTGWYHNVVTYDSAVGVKIYVNGVEQPKSNASGGNASHSTQINNTVSQYIGARNSSGTVEYPWDGEMSQVYFIDGQALGPEYFGFTDPLTGTWRPKKFDIRAEVSKNPNNGTTWSSTTDSGLTYANGVTGIFDGNLSTRGGAPSTNNNYATLTNNVSISCTNGIRIYWNGVGAGQRYIRINGTTELDDGSAQLTPGWSPLSSFSGTINKIEVKSASSGSWSLAAIEVDGFILIDGAANNSFYLPMDGN